MSETPKESPGVAILAKTPGDDESHSGHIAIPMILNVLLQFHDDIHIFTKSTAIMDYEHECVHVHKYERPFDQSNWPLRLPGEFIYQLKYSLGLARYRRDIDLVFIRGSGALLPLFTSKLLRYTILSRIAGVRYQQEAGKAENIKGRIWSKFLQKLEEVLHLLSDILILTTPHVAEFAEIQNFQHKFHVWCHYYFDLNQFSIQIPFDERKPIIGQVAVVSETKGTLEFIESMEVVYKTTGAKLLIVGDGPLMEKAEKKACELNIDGEFTGRIPRKDVPNQLNRMKLHVLSSVSEGLPKAAIEAMACGTPVLATNVGGLPDIIEHGYTGFLMSSNEPDDIEKGIIDAIENHDLSKISKNSREFVEKNYSFESSLNEYHEMICEKTEYSLCPASNQPNQPIRVP